MELERDSNPGFEYGGRRPHPRQPLEAGNGTQTTGNKEVGPQFYSRKEVDPANSRNDRANSALGLPEKVAALPTPSF